MKEKQGANTSVYSYITIWKDVTLDKMKVFTAILLLIGLTRWSSFELINWWFYPDIRYIVPKDRFLRILSFYQFLDNFNAKPKPPPTGTWSGIQDLAAFWKTCATLTEILLSWKGTLSGWKYDSFQRHQFTDVDASKTNQVEPESLWASQRKNSPALQLTAVLGLNNSSGSQDSWCCPQYSFLPVRDCVFFHPLHYFHYLSQHSACGTICMNRKDVPNKIK